MEIKPTPESMVTTSPQPFSTLDLSGEGYTQELVAVRGVITEYWGGFNSYDKERVLALLTPEYHQIRAERIVSDIGRLKLFRVKLGWGEEAPPTVKPEGTAQVFIEIREPLGTRRVEMDFQKRKEGWRITFVEEVEKTELTPIP
ncbi:MAG: hypothetical protein HY676_05635 [Chloroflexi bacterium]|nr:hypothetical protein [Chloroflexota bacterium]